MSFVIVRPGIGQPDTFVTGTGVVLSRRYWTEVTDSTTLTEIRNEADSLNIGIDVEETPQEPVEPADKALATHEYVNDKVAPFSTWERGVSLAKWTAGGGVIDNGPAIQSAIDSLAPLVGTVFERSLYIPEAVHLSNQQLVNHNQLHIWGASRLGSIIRLGPTFPAGGVLLTCSATAASTVTLEGTKVPQSLLENFTLDGGHRAIQASALFMDYFDRSTINDVYITGFRGTALKARCLREATVVNLRTWMCGDGPNFPVVDMDETGNTAEGGNLNHFMGCTFALNMGDHLRIRTPATIAQNRVNWFTGCTFHGLNEWIEDYADEFGYYSVGQEGNTPCRFVLDNARTIFFTDCRLHLQGRGQPLFVLTDDTAGTATFNSVTVSTTALTYRGNVGSGRTISTVDTAADTMQLAGIQYPNGGLLSNRHQLQTGSRVRIVASGSLALPGGLVVATDYYVIKVDENNFKLATSRANAAAGTAIDLTSAGTGILYQYDWAATVSAAADTLTIPNHRLTTGARIQVGAATTQPGGVTVSNGANASDYFVIRVDKDTIKLASTYPNSQTGTAVDITSAGADVWVIVQDFLADVRAGTFIWGSGNWVDVIQNNPVRGYFRINDSNTPKGVLLYGAGNTLWAAGNSVPIAEYASGASAQLATAGHLVLSRNNTAIYGSLVDGTLVQMLRLTAGNAVTVGALSGTANAQLISNGGLTQIYAKGVEVARFDSTKIGFLGKVAAPVVAPTLPADATDLASAIALVNAIKAALRNNGLAL